MRTPTITENDSILARLKARTAHQHEQTEDGVDLMSADFSLADYRKLLVKFYAFYEPFEKKMRSALAENAIDFDYERRANLPKLRTDLKNLGMSDAAIKRIAPTDDLPALDSPEKIFGALYVVEGSTLGGQIIARHLQKKFARSEATGVSFFSGYGAETGKMWNDFRAAITEFAGGSGVDDEEIIKSANETFAKIGKSLAD